MVSTRPLPLHKERRFIPGINDPGFPARLFCKVSWEMSRCGIGGIDVAPFSQELMKQPGGISPGFFCPIVPETHVSSILDQLLNNPFPEVIGQCHPINLSLSVSLKKCIDLWFPDKDEIALFGSQHHLIPIDHKHVTSMVTEQIGWMQIRVRDDVWQCSRLEHLC